ncbi:Kelch-like protein 20 [Desmophyllum pertusum]|uniref:Kelch-like protein 20 n=1 Tax=Desmophyllum pertusum TaxID=174260 RepID=A0A9W9YU69_9CNID|nr:Kelch-like protein 20 [Desmophyllum pertusum]
MQVPQRYNFATRQWQSIATVGTIRGNYQACNSGAIVHSKVLVLYGNAALRLAGLWHPAVLNCFDPVKNEWEVKAITCCPHFGSSLFVVNSRLYVAGGCIGFHNNLPSGSPAPVVVYDEVNNTWSVVEQKHIPSNNLGAVEIEGRVYFTVNKFPIDSGIRIPPGELYPVPLGEWNNLATINQYAVLCYSASKEGELENRVKLQVCYTGNKERWEFVQLRLDLHNYCLLCTVADRHGLRDLQEAAEQKMASTYKDVCESEEFLTLLGADQLISLLSRDDLSAPSETFVFKSVMQWINTRRKRGWQLAAKVIGAVRLGLVDIRVVIEELDTEEMQQFQRFTLIT